MVLSANVRIKLQAMAIEHGIPYLAMIQRIRENSNLSGEEEDFLRQACNK